MRERNVFFSTRLAIRNSVLRACCRETYYIEGVLRARNDALSTFFTEEKKHLQEVFKGRIDMFRMLCMHPENVLQDRKDITRRIALRNSTSKAHCRGKLDVELVVHRRNGMVLGHFKDKKSCVQACQGKKLPVVT